MIDWGKVKTATDKSAELRAAKLSAFKSAIQAHLDAEAISLGYDSIASAVTYADEPSVPKFQAEGVSFRAWRSVVWDYSYAQLALFDSGEMEEPSIADFLDGLPKRVAD